MNYPKRLIEVDLPIKRISAHARREKSIRHGHISTLHIWWARRPLAACRAVICAALWPDPADELCPEKFRQVAEREMRAFATAARSSEEIAGICDNEAWERYGALASIARPMDLKRVPLKEQDGTRRVGSLTDLEILRGLLLDFIADFAAWEASTNKVFLQTACNLTQAAHEALGGSPGTRPLVVDSFAGGGSIPLEALRVGADAFASDINPLAVLLNKVVLEYIPKYGQRLADEVRRWGEWIKQAAEKELAAFYPKDPDGATPVAYLWARTIKCEGPGCGAEVPLIRSLWLAKKANRPVALQLVPHPRAKRVEFKIIVKQRGGWVNQDNLKEKIAAPRFDGTVKRGSATCPCCGYTTPVARVREQLRDRRGGTDDARLFCVVILPSGSDQRTYRNATSRDTEAFAKARRKAAALSRDGDKRNQAAFPDEAIPLTEIRRINAPIYGMTCWADLFSVRQRLAISTLIRLSASAAQNCKVADADVAVSVATVMGLAISRFTDICNALCIWESSKTQVRHLFNRQAIPMVWDFAEPHIFADAAGNFGVTLGTMLEVIERQTVIARAGMTQRASATQHPLPTDCADAFVTDPPYYDAVPYAHLADFFHVWLRRSVGDFHSDLFGDRLAPKDAEIVVDRPHELSNSTHDIAFYERELAKAFTEGRRVAKPEALGTIVFASKSTASWEAILKAVIDAGWIITGSWPIDTELENRVSAQGQARLASSVHLVCRPRENPDGSVRTNEVGDWRDVLAELPRRIHEWMPRLADEGVVGADAIFSCLGPALEIFSRYSRVEKASGEAVPLREYLEQVWAVIAREALDSIFKGADTRGFEQDARLTAIWFWVMKEANGNGNGRSKIPSGDASEAEDADDEEEDGPPSVSKNSQGYAMEFDAARKLAQGLGADLTEMARPGGILAVQGSVATLLSVSTRASGLAGRQFSLFDGPADARTSSGRKRLNTAKLKSVGSRSPQLFDPQPDMPTDPFQPYLPGFEPPRDERSVVQRLLDNGTTVLDRLHQAMLLFGRGQTSLLKPFLTECGMGKSDHFWTLADCLCKLYPAGSDEKRWVDGVLARKKGLEL